MKSDPPVRGVIFFCFANPAGFSGQKAATELVLHGLRQRGWECRRLPQPVLDRRQGGLQAVGRFVGALAAAWLRALALPFTPGAWLCVNLGQTRAAFLRDAIPLLLGALTRDRSRVVVSLHGSLFLRWPAASRDARLFCFLLRRAGKVTVLGEGQRDHLIALGVPGERVVVLVNSCDLAPLDEGAVIAKQEPSPRADETVRALFLSSLIDSKGFPEYLEALRELTLRPGPRIDAVLCGQLVASEFSTRFGSLGDAEQWIERQLAAINLAPGRRVQVWWIRGAACAAKAALFRAANIFVLPTRYAVEAQPLVLLEAMASGCAIVTTRAGEIPTILDGHAAALLDEVSVASVADALQFLAADAPARGRLARAAHRRFVDRYQLSRHLDAWSSLLAADFAPAMPALASERHVD